MKIMRRDNRFIAIDEDKNAALGQITWVEEDGRIVIEHTFVKEEYSGQGVGRALLDEVVALARSNNQKIIPQCVFAIKQFHDNPEEFADVWEKK
ncbi:GNAT family N-acetyltransferase [Vagococcus acidifermentans]|uniref:Uncharacterized protein n=1 Tax=Vagococcus acidifermentans TaxID=564710 RepID=A0A430AR82_9ENTE|nr:GNAT family N-acetyltransferase [Vagococcus acidifermentans]RSU10464.1 hypothetical protein CBF27_10665 [Vagococcus acidifermentans]